MDDEASSILSRNSEEQTQLRTTYHGLLDAMRGNDRYPFRLGRHNKGAIKALLMRMAGSVAS